MELVIKGYEPIKKKIELTWDDANVGDIVITFYGHYYLRVGKVLFISLPSARSYIPRDLIDTHGDEVARIMVPTNNETISFR